MCKGAERLSGNQAHGDRAVHWLSESHGSMCQIDRCVTAHIFSEIVIAQLVCVSGASMTLLTGNILLLCL